MARFLVVVFALVASVCSYPGPSMLSPVSARNGQVSIGRVSGGSFGQGSFTVGEPGRSGGSYGWNQPQYVPRPYQPNNMPQYPFGGRRVGYGSTGARNGQVAIGRVTGGSFAPGSFSVGEPGRNYGYGRTYSLAWNRPQYTNVPQYGYSNQNGPYGVARARNGQVAIGRVSGGSFAPGIFSVGEPGRTWPQYSSNDQKGQPSVTAKDGEIAIGKVSGGSVGPGTFSVNEPGRRYPISDDSSDNKKADTTRHQEANNIKPENNLNNKNDNPRHPHVIGYNNGDGTSITIDKISGGWYPDNSFSIGHGKDSVYGDGGDGGDVTF